MARIGTDRMIVRGEQREDNSWLFTICYTAYFSERDLGRRFDDSVIIGEAHNDNHPAYAQPVVFTATSPMVFRKKRIILRNNFLQDSVLHNHSNGDQPNDAVCAWIRLHNAESVADSVDDEQRTPVLVPVVKTGQATERADSLRHAPAQSLRC